MSDDFDYGEGKTPQQEVDDSMAMLAVAMIAGAAVLGLIGIVLLIWLT